MRFVSDASDGDHSAKGPCLQVLGAGLPRCATSSLQEALEMPVLGYAPCMHMAHIAPHAARLRIVIAAMQEPDRARRQALLHRIWDGYQSTTDFPGFWFIDDLMDMYPDAAIVLNQRPGGGAAWWRSLDDSLMFFASRTYRLACLPFATDRLHYRIHMLVAARMQDRFGVDRLGPHFYDVYQRYVVREAEKRGRPVLLWQPRDGWAPLCKFLGRPVPAGVDFPHVNDAATMTILKRVLVARGLLAWAALFASAYATWAYAPHLLRVGWRLVDTIRPRLQ